MAIVTPLDSAAPTCFGRISRRRRVVLWLGRIAPGLALCLAVTAVAIALQALEEVAFGRPWLDALVLAILIGTALRSLGLSQPGLRPGIAFSAKLLLEIAVVLLGASLSLGALQAVGIELLAGIAVVVALAIAASYGIGRMLGLPQRMAILIACGNAICGNSAIAAAAPVIGADGKDVAAAIAFTAVLGVLVVLGLPLLIPAFGLTPTMYGVLSGLTVYAVPQVLAATTPAGALAVQVGTLVKLVRVLMLGPVVLGLSLIAGRLGPELGDARPTAKRIRLHQAVPWFILAFLAMVALRSLDLLPGVSLPPMARIANLLTVVSMAALGLGVDVRVVARAGMRVTATVTLSLLVLGIASLALIRLLALP
jgi:uncharacterized integral membrane protein (TIGR00698 family)